MEMKKLGKLKYEVPAKLEDELERSVAGFRKKTGLVFRVVAQEKAKSLPWLIVDREALAERRLTEALKIARNPESNYKVSRQAQGTVELRGRDIVITVESSSIPNLSRKLQAIWPAELVKAGAENGTLQKLGRMLKMAEVRGIEDLQEEEEEEELDELEDAPELKPLSQEEMEEVLGPDGALVSEAAGALSNLLELLDDDEEEPEDKLTALLSSVEELESEDSGKLVRQFMEAAQNPTGNPKRLKTGDEVDTSTQLTALALKYTELLEAQRVLNELIDQWEEYNDAIGVLNGQISALAERALPQPGKAPDEDALRELRKLDREGKTTEGQRDEVEARINQWLNVRLPPLQQALEDGMKTLKETSAH